MTSTLPQLLKKASVSSHSYQNRSATKAQPFRPPGWPSKSASAETEITSGNAAGTNVLALTAELPAPPTSVIPAALAAQMAAWSASLAQSPQARSSPKLMFATCTSLVGSPSVARPMMWSSPQSTIASDEFPASSKTLIGTRWDSGATPSEAHPVEW